MTVENKHFYNKCLNKGGAQSCLMVMNEMIEYILFLYIASLYRNVVHSIPRVGIKVTVNRGISFDSKTQIISNYFRQSTLNYIIVYGEP